MVAIRREDIEHARRVAGRPALRLVEPPPRRVREDALPEHTEYRDTGCDLASSCLACPLARCKHDEPGALARTAMAARDREIAYLRRRHGAPVDMLARTYGLSRRTIFRIMRREEGGGDGRKRRRAAAQAHEEARR